MSVTSVVTTFIDETFWQMQMNDYEKELENESIKCLISGWNYKVRGFTLSGGVNDDNRKKQEVGNGYVAPPFNSYLDTLAIQHTQVLDRSHMNNLLFLCGLHL